MNTFITNFDYAFGKFPASKHIEDEILKISNFRKQKVLYRKCMRYIISYRKIINGVRNVPDLKLRHQLIKFVVKDIKCNENTKVDKFILQNLQSILMAEIRHKFGRKF